MFLPKSLRCDDFELLQEVIEDLRLGTLITQSPGGEVIVDHVPCVFESPTGEAPWGVLHTHVARANPHWLELLGASNHHPATLTFHTPGAYISPHLYQSYSSGARHVPTFYYVAVHARGRLELYEDATRLIAHLEALSTALERSHDPAWTLEDAEEVYRTKLLSGIVGVRVILEQPLVGKFKLGQNRELADRQSVLQSLEQGSLLERHIARYLARNLDSAHH